MKKFVLAILMVTFIYSLSSATGNESEKKVKFPDNLKKHLNSEVEYPENARKEKIEGYVAVMFSVNSDGQLEILATSANNTSLRQHVKEQLEDIQLCPFDLSVGNTYSITFYFDLL